MLVAALTSLAFSAAVCRIARLCGVAGERDSVVYCSRRLGGAASYVGFHAGCAAVFLLPWIPFVGQFNSAWWGRLAAGGLLVVAAGALRDAARRPKGWMWAADGVAALVAYTFGLRLGCLFGVALPPAADAVGSVAWLLLVMSAFRIIDRLPGLAPGVGLIASTALAGSFLLRHEPSDAMVVACLAGVCLALVRVRRSRAAGMGAGGSMLLGFTFASISMETGAKGLTLVAIAVPLLAVGYPLFERLALGEPGTCSCLNVGGGRDAQRLGDAAMLVYLAAIGLVVAGLASMMYRSRAIGIYTLAFVAGVVIALNHLARTIRWEDQEALAERLCRPPGRVVAVILYPLLDALLMMGVSGVAVLLTLAPMSLGLFKRTWFDQLWLWVGLPFLVMVVAGIYRRVWSRARASDFAYVMMVQGLATLLAGGVIGVTMPGDGRAFIPCVLLYALMSLLLLVTVRISPRVAQEMSGWLRRRQIDPQAAWRRILVYGAGDRGLLYLRTRPGRFETSGKTWVVVGLVDDDPNLHGRMVYGYPVLGGVDRLSWLIRKTCANEIMVCASLPPSRFDELTRVAREHDVTVSTWYCGVTTDKGSA